MAQRFLVTTPNEQYNERALGVQFARGQAVVDSFSIDKSLGLTVEEVARRMKLDFGYEVEEIGSIPKDEEAPAVPVGTSPKAKKQKVE